ncbi:hypothetical protein [Actinoplanes sp. NPDC049118]|uniref:hypothetical protein n=1 Tax=Actinoplanes sp. NPDC049118 TaxID=3155769 RepID=UPI0034042DF7
MSHAEDAYGFARPTVNDAHSSLTRVLGKADDVWTGLLQRCGLTGAETDTASVKAIIAAMFAAGDGADMCARSLQIRLAAHTHLAAVRQLVTAAA